MDTLGNAVKYIGSVPSYLKYMWAEHPVITASSVALFVFVALFNFKFVSFLRKVVVAALLLLALTGAINGRRQHGYQVICVSFLALLLLFLIRILISSLINTRRSILNAKLEKRQLEKARQRRGDFANRQGYSGKTKIAAAPATEVDKTAAEIKDLISKEASSGEAAKEAEESYPEVDELAGDQFQEDDDLPDGVFYAKPNLRNEASSAFSGNSLLAADVYETLLKLGELKNAGILSSDEFEAKKTELLAKIR